MAFFGLVRSGKKEKPRYEFTDEDREMSANMRRQKQEFQLELMRMEHENMRLQIDLKNAELRARMADLLPEGEEDLGMAGELFKPIIQAALGGGLLGAKNTPPIPTEQKPPLRAPLTDEQIRGIVDDLPPAGRKFARKASDETLKTFARNLIPDLSDNELERALKIVRE